ncbi:MAG: hypothetical protein P9L95_10330 [Candidatus Tenebribacter mawsonii]|nr:hypothetical protein [Candidatus Tenebribacter mawsonii]
MNKQQKVIILCMLLAIFLLLIFPPFNKIRYRDGEKEFIGHRIISTSKVYDSERNYRRAELVYIDSIRLVIYVFIVIIMAFALTIITKNKKLNFNKGFFRMTLILSLIIGLIALLTEFAPENIFQVLVIILGFVILSLMIFVFVKYIVIKILKYILDGFTKIKK